LVCFNGNHFITIRVNYFTTL